MALIDISIEVLKNVMFMPTESMIENNTEKEKWITDEEENDAIIAVKNY